MHLDDEVTKPFVDRSILKDIRTILVVLTMLAAPGMATVADNTEECVILLHGMARTSASMYKMESELTAAGYFVANIDYPSRHHRIEVLAPMAVEAGLEQCRENVDYETVHFVTHSLGGILVRYYLDSNEIDKMGRVVMLGPPNQGSNAADALRGVPGFEWVNGPAALQLGKGPDSVPLQLGEPDFEVGIIAGNRTIDPITSQVLENPDDGRVTVDDTKLEGMSDFRLVAASHAFMMQKPKVIELVKAFLDSGNFAGYKPAD